MTTLRSGGDGYIGRGVVMTTLGDGGDGCIGRG